MTLPESRPTDDDDVNTILREFTSRVTVILGDQVRGFYLEGSLALGDFNPERSDIDCLVLTDGDVVDDCVASLHDMHAQLAEMDHPWATELEVSYIPMQTIRRYDPSSASHPRIMRGPSERLSVQKHYSDWVVHRHILREHGIVLAGPPLQSLIDPVHPDDLRRSMVELTHQWCKPLLEDPLPVQDWGFRTFTVVTMCRVLYTLHHGTVVPKSVAARWAQAGPGAKWSPLINRAVNWLPTDREDEVEETLDLVRSVGRYCDQHTQAVDSVQTSVRVPVTQMQDQ